MRHECSPTAIETLPHRSIKFPSCEAGASGSAACPFPYAFLLSEGACGGIEFVVLGFWPFTIGYIALICSAMVSGSASWLLIFC